MIRDTYPIHIGTLHCMCYVRYWNATFGIRCSSRLLKRCRLDISKQKLCYLEDELVMPK